MLVVTWLASHPIITPVQRRLLGSKDQVSFHFRSKRGVAKFFLPLSSPLEPITYLRVDNARHQQP